MGSLRRIPVLEFRSRNLPNASHMRHGEIESPTGGITRKSEPTIEQLATGHDTELVPPI